MRDFLMSTKGLTEDEAISLISIGVDFGVTQVVDGNWGIHAIVKKSLFRWKRLRVRPKSLLPQGVSAARRQNHYEWRS